MILKTKCEASQDFVGGGFADPRGSRAGLGALLVGYFDCNELVSAGPSWSSSPPDARPR